MEKKEFKKKIFKKIDRETLAPFPSVPTFTHDDENLKEIKIDAHFEKECKRLFIPLLDEIIQMQHHIKTQSQFYQLHSIHNNTRSKKEILQKLYTFKASVEESKRWCDSLLLHIEKGIEELTTTDDNPLSTHWITQMMETWKKS